MAAQTREEFGTLADDVRQFAVDINKSLVNVKDEATAELQGIEERMTTLNIRLGE